MFTGIIEEVGTIQAIKKSGDSFVITIATKKILKDAHLGDSISVNGVCLTITSFNQERFTVDVMPETVHATSLRTLSNGSKVNLERAMAAGGRFGGHFVSGHIDGIGEIIEKNPEDNAVYYTIKIPKHLRRYIVMKGSIAVDGTSLTVFGSTENTFIISLIPHTLSETILGGKGRGDIVNLECDMVGKYIEQMISLRLDEGKAKNPSLTKEFLQEHGF